MVKAGCWLYKDLGSIKPGAWAWFTRFWWLSMLCVSALYKAGGGSSTTDEEPMSVSVGEIDLPMLRELRSKLVAWLK